jgi:ATP synthase protein I
VLPADRAGQPAVMTAELRPGGGHTPDSSPEQPRPPQENDGWRILSYMIGGMLLYGGIGWLVGHWTGLSFLFPIGMILGIGLSIVLIVFRVSRS